ncbi:MAG: AAA family ATPase [Pseudomonadota bacterium]
MKVLVISENNKLLESITAFASLKQKSIGLTTIRSSLLNATQRIANEIPDVVILDIGDAKYHEFELVERFKAQYKNMAFMMMSDDNSSELLLKAMRSGFSEVMPLPLIESQLIQALDRHQSKQMSNARHESNVLSVISCKGGSGATFIATNLGYVLARLFNKKVLLIDVNQYFGDASMYVSEHKPKMTLADVCNQMHRLDYAFLESSLVTVLPNYKILAAADNPASAVDILPEHLEKIIRIARNYYDYIILDVGTQIDALTVKALDLSDTIYPILQLVLPYIRDAKHLTNVFKSLGYSSAKIQPIVNRYDKSGKLKLSDLSGAIFSADAITVLPNDYVAVTDSVNQGVGVIALYPGKPISKALIILAEKITKSQLAEKGLIARMLGKS